MLVVAVVAILAATVVFGYGDTARKKAIESEARRLVNVLELARREALLRNDTLAVTVEKNGYAVAERVGDDEWQPLHEKPFGPHTLEEGVSLENPNGKGSKKNSSTIVVWQNGELTPFDLMLKAEDFNSWHVTSDGFARVEARLVPPDGRLRTLILTL